MQGIGEEIMASWQYFDEEIKNLTVLTARYSSNVASFTFRFAHEIEEYEAGKWKALVVNCNSSVPVPGITPAEFLVKIKERFKVWRAKLDSEKTVRDTVEGYIGLAWNIT